MSRMPSGEVVRWVTVQGRRVPIRPPKGRAPRAELGSRLAVPRRQQIADELRELAREYAPLYARVTAAYGDVPELDAALRRELPPDLLRGYVEDWANDHIPDWSFAQSLLGALRRVRRAVTPHRRHPLARETLDWLRRVRALVQEIAEAAPGPA